MKLLLNRDRNVIKIQVENLKNLRYSHVKPNFCIKYKSKFYLFKYNYMLSVII